MSCQQRLLLAGVLVVALIVALIPHAGEREKERAIPAPKKIVKEESNKATMKEKKANERTAKLFASAGWRWRGREWTCLKYVWTRESRFDHKADNPKSSAYGIAQLLGEQDVRSEYQILRGLRYIDKRYGSPCKAKNFFLKHRYY